MTQLVGVLSAGGAKAPPLYWPAVEAFPTSLPIAGLPGLGEHLRDETIARLRDIEGRLRQDVPIGPILRVRTQRSLDRALTRAWEVAVDYYVEAGILIWRDLGHDYTKLLHLSRVSGKAVEHLFFQNARRLERDTFISAVAGLRVLGQLGEAIIQAEEKAAPERRTPPVDYLDQVVYATFLTWCLLAYLQGDVKKTRRANLRLLAQEMLSVGNQASRYALEQNLYSPEKEGTYWSPSWQEAEVEADLDVRFGDVKSFGSVEALLRDLHRS